MGHAATTLLALHLCLNYLAVRSVTMHSLNRQRANLVFSHLLAHDKVLTPAQVSRLEVVFERDGVLRWLGAEVLGRATIGVGMRELVLADGGKGGDGSAPDLYELHELFGDEEYLLCANATGTAVAMALRRGCSARGQLRAWLHALVLAREASERRGRGASSSPEKEKGGDRARAAAVASSLDAHAGGVGGVRGAARVGRVGAGRGCAGDRVRAAHRRGSGASAVSCKRGGLDARLRGRITSDGANAARRTQQSFKLADDGRVRRGAAQAGRLWMMDAGVVDARAARRHTLSQEANT